MCQYGSGSSYLKGWIRNRSISARIRNPAIETPLPVLPAVCIRIQLSQGLDPEPVNLSPDPQPCYRNTIASVTCSMDPDPVIPRVGSGTGQSQPGLATLLQKHHCQSYLHTYLSVWIRIQLSQGLYTASATPIISMDLLIRRDFLDSK